MYDIHLTKSLGVPHGLTVLIHFDNSYGIDASKDPGYKANSAGCAICVSWK